MHAAQSLPSIFRISALIKPLGIGSRGTAYRSAVRIMTPGCTTTVLETRIIPRQVSIVSELEVGPFYMKRHVGSGPVRSLHCDLEPCCTRGGTDWCLQRCAAQVRATCMVIRQPPIITIMIGTTRIMHILFDILDCSMGGLYCSRWGGRYWAEGILCFPTCLAYITVPISSAEPASNF